MLHSASIPQIEHFRTGRCDQVQPTWRSTFRRQRDENLENGVPLSSIFSISKMITSCQQNNHPAHLLHPRKHALKRLAKPICISFRTTIYCPSTTLSSTQHVSLIHVNAAMRNLLCWVNSRPYLFFKVTLCLRNHQSRFPPPYTVGHMPYREYLSSGENLAGCADLVTSLPTTFFKV